MYQKTIYLIALAATLCLTCSCKNKNLDIIAENILDTEIMETMGDVDMEEIAEVFPSDIISEPEYRIQENEGAASKNIENNEPSLDKATEATESTIENTTSPTIPNDIVFDLEENELPPV